MATTRELFVFVKQHFNLSLEKNELWTRLAAEINTAKMDSKTLSQFLMYTYPTLVQKLPKLAPLTDVLFMRLMDDMLKIVVNQAMRALDMKLLFSSWTQCGTRDIPNEYAATLASGLDCLLLGNTFHKSIYAAMVCQSPKLWSLRKNAILESYNDFAMLIYRYETHRKDLHNFKHVQIVDFYERMCGINLDTRPTLKSLKNSLHGTHNNALAWHTALAVCDLKDPTIVGSWMKMSETFSALPLEPKDQNSWRFWHSLSTCCANDASGQELLTFLAEAKREMFQAFDSSWCLINTLYEGDFRYVQASLAFESSLTSHHLLPIPNTHYDDCN